MLVNKWTSTLTKQEEFIFLFSLNCQQKKKRDHMFVFPCKKSNTVLEKTFSTKLLLNLDSRITLTFKYR